MNKTTKGAIAAAAAGVLLLGGAGSLAFWTAEQDVPGGTINAGHLGLATDATNAGCGDWVFADAEGTEVFADTSNLVPGDVIEMDCAFTVQAEGDHLRASIEASSASLTGALANALVLDVSDLTVNGATATEITDANDGQALGVTVSVTFTDPGTADNTYNQVAGNLQAVLDDVTVTATQAHA